MYFLCSVNLFYDRETEALAKSWSGQFIETEEEEG